jgi:hypothetical protein
MASGVEEEVAAWMYAGCEEFWAGGEERMDEGSVEGKET